MVYGLDRKNILCSRSYLIIDESFLKNWGSLLMYYHSKVCITKQLNIIIINRLNDGTVKSLDIDGPLWGDGSS